MKTLKFTLAIIVIAFLTSSNVFSQVGKQDVVVTISGVDYGPGIGTVYGTYTYHFVWQLSDEGFIECLHWNARNFDLYNASGDKVKIVDSGHDTYGVIWDFYNNPAFYNTGWNIEYSVPDGWLNDIMPSQMPAEGAFINMSLKLFCKGTMLKWGSMVVFHLNANGDITVDFAKSFAEK
jgi:hypothetical protein